jgi:hypothetical protein
MIKRMTTRLGFGLSRELWLVVLGMFLNYLGYGAVLPFEIIICMTFAGSLWELPGWWWDFSPALLWSFLPLWDLSSTVSGHVRLRPAPVLYSPQGMPG